MNRLICAFTGASGTGKTTLLNLLIDEGFTIVELSGRPYLPTKGDYVSNKSDSINRRISYGSTVTFTKSILSLPNSNLFFSRCAIDKLAYGKALSVGEDLHDIIVKEIEEVVKPFIKVFYLPVEFELKNEDDEVRGNNEKARKDTDNEIRRILELYSVPHTVITGTVEQRMSLIKSKISILNKKN